MQAEALADASCDAPHAFLRDCLDGLAGEPKTLPCKWLFDREGSRLFEAICDVPEYYPSRTEAALLTRAVPDIAASLANGTTLVEFGSGASRKTRTLLDAASAIATYVPIDISRNELAQSCALFGRTRAVRKNSVASWRSQAPLRSCWTRSPIGV